MAIIRHYTKPHWVENILNDGFINLETAIDEEKCKKRIDEYWGPGFYRPQPLHAQARYHHWFAHRPHYAWLTEDVSANSGYSGPGAKDCYFEFDSDVIGARKWHYVKRDLKGAQAQKVISEMDRISKVVGDDPYKYWVCQTEIDISLAIPNKGVLANPNKFLNKELEPI